MTKRERLEAIEELWLSCDSEDWFDENELTFYPKEIREDMVQNEQPKDASDPKYDYIIKDALKGMFYGVKNSYLLELLLKSGIEVSEVTGENDKLEECPCCGYLTTPPGMDGFAEICNVCFWENTGEGANHITLKEAQENFKKYGAMDQGALKFVDPDGKMKYEITVANTH